MVELSYSYVSLVISKMVKTDPRFSVIHQHGPTDSLRSSRLNKPIDDVVFFFEKLFIRLIHAWIRVHPEDFFGFDETIHIHHIMEIVREIEREYNTPSLHYKFILDFFRDALHLCKTQLSSPLYEHVLMKTLDKSDKQNGTHKRSGDHKRIEDGGIVKQRKLIHHPRSNKMAVIVDPRYDPLMEAVIRNFMHFMNPCGWNLMIFSHESHRTKIVADFPTCLFAPIDECWMISGQASMTIDSYNKIFMMKSFWESIPSTHIAIFQKDCVMYKMFDESLYLQYDFAGAYFKDQNAEAFFYGGINGGFSLRNRDAMIECCEYVSWEDIIRYNTLMRNHMYAFVSSSSKLGGVASSKKYTPDYELKTFHEDVFFSNACEILRKRIPDSILRERLAIEASGDVSHFPCVYHGWNKNYHTINVARQLLEKSEYFFPYIHDVSD